MPESYSYEISEQELEENLRMTPEQKLAWLSQMLLFTWKATRGRIYSWEDLNAPEEPTQKT